MFQVFLRLYIRANHWMVFMQVLKQVGSIAEKTLPTHLADRSVLFILDCLPILSS